MTISFDCDNCGKSYRLKDEAAGKRLRCKKCNTPLQVPTMDEDDFLSEVGEDDWNDYGDDAAFEPTPARRRKPTSSQSKKGKKKRKKKKRGGISGRKVAAIARVGLRLSVVAILLVGTYFAVTTGANPEWIPFSPPGVDLKVSLPRKPERKHVALDGATEHNFIATTPGFVCNFTYAKLPPDSLALADLDAGYDLVRTGKLRSHVARECRGRLPSRRLHLPCISIRRLKTS